MTKKSNTSFFGRIFGALKPNSIKTVNVTLVTGRQASIPYDKIKESFINYCKSKVNWPLEFFYSNETMIATDKCQRKFTLNLNSFILDIKDIDDDACDFSDDHTLNWRYQLDKGEYKLRVTYK